MHWCGFTPKGWIRCHGNTLSGTIDVDCLLDRWIVHQAVGALVWVCSNGLDSLSGNTLSGTSDVDCLLDRWIVHQAVGMLVRACFKGLDSLSGNTLSGFFIVIW